MTGFSKATAFDAALGARRALDAVEPYSAGRDAAKVRQETGYSGAIVRLASNEGSEGPFPAALAAIIAALPELQRYPQSGASALTAALAKFHGVMIDEVLVTGGGCSALAHLASALLEPGDEAVFGNPTFHLYRQDVLRMGALPVAVALTADGRYDLDALRVAVNSRTRFVYICNPNNPTGGLVPRAALEAFLADLPTHVLPIVDEAYFEYVDSPDYPDPVRARRLAERPIVIVRTFSKIYGLAGARIGYAIAPPAIVAACRKVQNPYEVNRLAQVAALASLQSHEELDQRLARNRTARELLITGLQELGIEPLPSQANFVCVRGGDATRTARALEQHGIIVRPLNAMGDPTSIRVTVGTAHEIAAFLAAFKTVRAHMNDADCAVKVP